MIYSIADIEKLVNDSVRRISFTFNEPPLTLFEPIEYILSIGGKRLRPVMALLSANLFSDEIELALPSAIAVEIFHNFSLLHDDLMDRADMRRGHLTVHKKWNDNTAILSGDAMLIEAYKYLANVPSKLLSPLLDIFTQTALEVCQGQQYDMDFESRTNVEEKEYLEMIRLKTAVLIACALKMGAMSVDAPETDADLLYRFGINIGMAFQLKDDLLDVYGDSKTFGKNIGGDILCNKKTFLLIKALERSNPVQRRELEKWLDASDYDAAEKINAVKGIYDELKLRNFTDNFIEQYYLSALDCLSEVSAPEFRKKELYSLLENLMYREK